MFNDDEELARSTDVGRLAHTAIAELAATARQPTFADLIASANAALSMFAPIEARAHRQNVVGLAGSYFWHLQPPADWRFAGRELQLGSGRVDLLWADPAGRLLVDEIKAGCPRAVRLAATHAQARRYAQIAHAVWGERFVGVRLLALRAPQDCLLFTADGHPRPLHHTPYLRKKAS
jgi:hypothetical protein